MTHHQTIYASQDYPNGENHSVRGNPKNSAKIRMYSQLGIFLFAGMEVMGEVHGMTLSVVDEVSPYNRKLNRLTLTADVEFDHAPLGTEESEETDD